MGEVFYAAEERRYLKALLTASFLVLYAIIKKYRDFSK